MTVCLCGRRACALLACRAMADSAGLASAAALATHGVRLTDEPGLINEVGEAAVGVEQIPERVQVRVDVEEAEFVRVPGGGTSLTAPASLSSPMPFWLVVSLAVAMGNSSATARSAGDWVALLASRGHTPPPQTSCSRFGSTRGV